MNFESNDASKKQIYRDKLRELLNRVPKGSTKWHHQRAVAFKDCAKKSESMITNTRATIEKLADQVRLLEQFYNENV